MPSGHAKILSRPAILLALSFWMITGCGKLASNEPTKVVESPEDSEINGYQASQTYSDGVPVVQPKSWTAGAFWTWRDHETGTCDRWSFLSYDSTGTNEDWVSMKRERSIDCTHFDEVPLYFRFSTKSGRVLLTDDTGNTPPGFDTTPPADFQNVFDHFYGIQGGKYYKVARDMVDLGVGKVRVYHTDYFPGHYFVMSSYNLELEGVLLRSKDWRLLDFDKTKLATPYPSPTPTPTPSVNPPPQPKVGNQPRPGLPQPVTPQPVSPQPVPPVPHP